MSTPYIQIRDPDDLELSDEDGKSESSAETIGSPCATGDVVALISRSYEDDKEQQAIISDQSRLRILGWMIANTSATIGSVFINKLLFNTSTFKHDQLSFAAYHFAITGLLLCMLSGSPFRHFEARRVKTLEILPLSISLSMSVVVSNLSLAYTSALYYQIVRALIPPCVGAINYLFYKTMVPRLALMALIPMCMGVGMVTYYNPDSSRDDSNLPTTSKGIVLAFAGVVMTALHIVWMDVFQRRYKLDATQLLANESPLSSIVLLYVVPWADTLPVWNELPKNTWWLLLLSGVCTCVLIVSQMRMVAEVGPVSSTILENVKSILIIAFGGYAGGVSVTGASAPLIVLAIVGAVGFSIGMLKDRT